MSVLTLEGQKCHVKPFVRSLERKSWDPMGSHGIPRSSSTCKGVASARATARALAPAACDKRQRICGRLQNRDQQCHGDPKISQPLNSLQVVNTVICPCLQLIGGKLQLSQVHLWQLSRQGKGATGAQLIPAEIQVPGGSHMG